MHSITIPALDEASIRWIEKEAGRLNTSIESVVTRILNEAIKREQKKLETPYFSDLDALAGTWSNQVFDEFMSNTREFGKTDEEIWQ